MDNLVKTISVPGSLLLAGEYAVLEEGGLGITLAVEPRITVKVAEGPELVIRGRIGRQNGLLEASGTSEGDVKLFSDILDQCRKWLVWKKNKQPLPVYTIDIDAGYEADYGYSTAAALGLLHALLSGHEVPGEDFLRLAIIAYRHYQAGVGSGYDIAASLFGGIGLFQGGEHPQFTTLAFPHLSRLVLIRNPRPVITRQSIKQYYKWRTTDPLRVQDFVAESNRYVSDLAEAGSTGEALEILYRARQHSAWLGEEIGVPAYWEEYDELLNEHCLFYKTLGAGNELGICLVKDAAIPAELACLKPEPIVIAHEGLICTTAP